MHAHTTRRLAAVAVTLFVGAQITMGQAEGTLEESYIVEDTGSAAGQQAHASDEPAAGDSSAETGGAIREVDGPAEAEGVRQTQGPHEVDGPREVGESGGSTDHDDGDEPPRVRPAPRQPVTKPLRPAEPVERSPDAGTIEVVETERQGEKPAVLPLAPEKASKIKTGRSARDDYAGISIGLRLGYFAYNEIFPEDETLEFLGVDRVEGVPKSSEYGLCEGLELDLMGRIPGSPMFVRPRLSGYLGIMHRYDGSTQADIREDVNGDTVAVYEPAQMRKNNYFLRGSVELGGGHFGRKGALTIFTGLDMRLWSRTFSRQEKEYYYWLNLPLGLAMHLNGNNGWRYGLETRVFFMAYGAMQYVYDTPGMFSTSPIDAPAVELSNEIPFGRRVSVRIEVPIQKRVGNALSLRFYPYFEYYHFGRSNVDTMRIDQDYDYYSEPGYDVVPFYEPASHTYVGGLSVDLVIHFRRRSYR